MPTRNTADWKEALRGYAVLISAGEKIPAETMEALRGGLRLISRFGVGTDEMDHAAATRCGIAICNAAGTLSTAVAECALGLTINLLRNLPEGDREVRRGDWSRFYEGRNGRQIEGKTIGLVGFGSIAQALARMLAGFECKILACDLFFDVERARSLGVRRADLSEILSESDVVSLHVPLTPETRHMVDEDFLCAMKPGAILINTARGALINERALVRALSDGALAAAGLDVFEEEPLPASSPLIKLDNVMLLPHSGAGTTECVTRAGLMAVQNAIDFLAGKPVPTILNPEYERFL
jgi:phosphoglycerate dehydrogenase-like enzyme